MRFFLLASLSTLCLGLVITPVHAQGYYRVGPGWRSSYYGYGYGGYYSSGYSGYSGYYSAPGYYGTPGYYAVPGYVAAPGTGCSGTPMAPGTGCAGTPSAPGTGCSGTPMAPGVPGYYVPSYQYYYVPTYYVPSNPNTGCTGTPNVNTAAMQTLNQNLAAINSSVGNVNTSLGSINTTLGKIQIELNLIKEQIKALKPGEAAAAPDARPALKPETVPAPTRDAGPSAREVDEKIRRLASQCDPATYKSPEMIIRFWQDQGKAGNRDKIARVPGRQDGVVKRE
jgi:hypothetical protein